MNTRNKTVFITGAGGGLGRSLVNQAILSGAQKVYAAVRKVKAPYSWDGSCVVPVQLDLNDPQSIQAAARVAQNIDLLINNAGTYTTGTPLDLSESDLRKDMDTNFFRTLRIVRTFAPLLAGREESAVVNIMSVAALAGMGGLGAYCASKAALLSATETLRVELKLQGTSLHSVFPGPIDTDMAKNITASKTKPDDVARMIFEGVNAGLEDIFPDEMSKAIGSQWLKDPKSVERSMGGLSL